MSLSDSTMPALYRRRFIPDELVQLKDDEIIFINNELILTRWKTLKPRKDFTHGRSCYYLNEGFKISHFIDKDENLLYTYCDLIETHYNSQENAYYFNDLLADVVVYPDGFVKVLDIAEISDALENDLITLEMAKNALRVLDKLLELIYSGKLSELSHILESEAIRTKP